MSQARVKGLLLFFLFVIPGFFHVSTGNGQEVTASYMPGTPFSKFKTYTWVAIPGSNHPEQSVHLEIVAAVEERLTDKGFSKAVGKTADLIVVYQVATHKEKPWNALVAGGLRWGSGMPTSTSELIGIGTIVLDMYDPSTKTLIWQGRATELLDPKNNQEKNRKNIEKAMKKLLKDFPPKQK